MEVELGLKITRTRDDITSLSDFRIVKDQSGPLFVSRETDTMFILIAHLKGYRRDNIDIKISEDGRKMAITGAKPVEEMVLKRWIIWKKNLVLRTFNKVFWVPEGVILDKIEAKFNEEDSSLTIRMPKMVKGITGVAIEEVKEEQDFDSTTQETSNHAVPEPESRAELEFKEGDEHVAETEPEPEEEAERGGQMIEEISKETQEVEVPREVEKTSTEKEAEPPALEPKEVQTETEVAAPVEEPQTESIPEETPEAETKPEPELQVEEPQTKPEKQEVESHAVEETIKPEPEPDQEEQREKKEQVHEQETQQVSNEIEESANEMRFPEEEERYESVIPEVEKQTEDSTQGEIQKKKKKKKPKLCPPLVFAGSAILVSLIVLVINFIRSKKR